MNEQAPVLYQEAFSSGWRKLVPWLKAGVVICVALMLTSAIFGTDEEAQILPPGFMLLAFVCGMAASYIKTYKPNAELTVTEAGIRTIEEGREIFVEKNEITDVSLATAGVNRRAIFYVPDPRNPGRHLPCNIRPHHIDFFSFKPFVGVLVRLRSEEVAVGLLQRQPRPTFIPSKNPEELFATLRRVWQDPVGR